ncbi:hypothetical protein [Halalkalicoccus subterraneus]|uniref:hypothetical protein n=1 Tax=Halalkalicoccus subterraneus TaxID=2675002 RepID=UPI000EFC5344|nr:hypothetical protein [Halalkalicoccus subterraneus]
MVSGLSKVTNIQTTVDATGIREKNLLTRFEEPLGIGSVLSKRVQTGFEDSHRNPIIETNSTSSGLGPLTMIDLDVRVAKGWV